MGATNRTSRESRTNRITTPKGGKMGTATEVETTETTSDTENTAPKGYAEYKLAGDIPEQMRGRLVRTREFSDLEAFRGGVQDGDDKHILKLAQAQYDIIVQRKVREALAGWGEEAASKEEDEKLSEGALAVRQGDWDAVQVAAQDVADGFVYGSRPAPSGESTKARRAVKALDVLTAASANDPEFAARLKALGITLG